MKRPLSLVLLAACLYLGTPSPALADAPNWQPADKVEVEENGKWYPSTVLKTDNGKFFIHYEGYSSQYDLWVGPERVRAIGGGAARSGTAARPTGDSTWAIGAPVEAQDPGNGKWYKATILAADNGRYHVHYDGYPSSDDRWLDGHQVHQRPAPELHPAIRNAYAYFNDAITAAETAIATKKSKADIKKALEDAESSKRSNEDQAKQHPDYPKLVARYWAIAVPLFDAYLAKSAHDASTTDNINWFGQGGSIEGDIELAKAVLDGYRAAKGDDAETARMEAALAKAHQVAEAGVTRIRTKAAAEQTMPVDRYSGGDKARLKALVLEAWNKEAPGSTVMAVRFPTNWERDASWSGNASGSHWQWNDVSILRVSIVVKTSATLATIYPAGVFRNNRNHGELEVIARKSGFNNYIPSMMLVKNVK